MSALEHLARASGVYWGNGTGPDPFVARAALTNGADGTVTLEYEAWSSERGLEHAEVARMGLVDGVVTLVAGSADDEAAIVFHEGAQGVFGSTGPERVGLVISMDDEGLSLSWWWPDEATTGDAAMDAGRLREQSRARLRPVRPIVTAPPLPGASGPEREAAVNKSVVPQQVPWPGVVVLQGAASGRVGQRLADEVPRAAVVRTDLLDAAVRGTDPRTSDPEVHAVVAVAVIRGYADAGVPVIVTGWADPGRLVDALAAQVSPVRVLEVADGDAPADVVRRLRQD